MRAFRQLAHHQLVGALQQAPKLVGGQRVGHLHDDPVGPGQVGRGADARAVDVAQKQLFVDLERQGVAPQPL